MRRVGCQISLRIRWREFVLKIMYVVFVTAYSLLLIFALIKSAREQKAFSIEKILMLGGSIFLLVSAVAVLQMYFPYLILLILGLSFIHIASILNGYKLHGKLNLSHHIIIFIITAVL